MLLCEANQWPTDVVEYFGNADVGGDECHMAFHFPVMPRIFMAVRRESRFPISEIMEQTPAIPESCQWGIFLRNHDELTLEMVTDEDRDYMWAEYAKDPRMKANIGIRRRLAPLLDNDINRMELFTALLLSLPGSPVLYYGDEIGMGDNIWLGDRDGVRTPMQWTPDRNAGFSSATPGKLHLPAIQDPVYGYQSVNVEAQLENSSSPAALDPPDDPRPARPPGLRPRHVHRPRRLQPERAVLRARAPSGRDVIVCVNNLSRFPQPVELDLRQWEGCVPVELLGGVPFPPIGELPYLLTLGGYGFYWFRLTPPRASRRTPSKEASHMTEHPQLEAYLDAARWFGGKGRDARVTGIDRIASLDGWPLLTVDLVTIAYDDGGADEVYQVPLANYAEPQGRLEHALRRQLGRRPTSATTSTPTTRCTTATPWRATCRPSTRPGSRELAGLTFHRLPGHEFDTDAHSTLFTGEQSNSSVAFGEDSVLKVFRKITPGINPDIAIHEVLTRAESEHVAALYGWVEARVG